MYSTERVLLLNVSLRINQTPKPYTPNRSRASAILFVIALDFDLGFDHNLMVNALDVHYSPPFPPRRALSATKIMAVGVYSVLCDLCQRLASRDPGLSLVRLIARLSGCLAFRRESLGNLSKRFVGAAS